MFVLAISEVVPSPEKETRLVESSISDRDGEMDGDTVGFAEGKSTDGVLEGTIVGVFEGITDGFTVGMDGRAVGFVVGDDETQQMKENLIKVSEPRVCRPNPWSTPPAFLQVISCLSRNTIPVEIPLSAYAVKSSTQLFTGYTGIAQEKTFWIL